MGQANHRLVCSRTASCFGLVALKPSAWVFPPVADAFLASDHCAPLLQHGMKRNFSYPDKCAIRSEIARVCRRIIAHDALERRLASPLVTIQFANGADDSPMPVMRPVAHVQPRYVHPVGRQCLQHFRRAGAWPNGADDFRSPRALEACIHQGAIRYCKLEHANFNRSCGPHGASHCPMAS